MHSVRAVNHHHPHKGHPGAAILLVVLLLFLSGCAGLGLGSAADSPEGQTRWVQRTLDGMTLRQQAASLVVVAVTAGYAHVDSPERLRIEGLVRDLGIGGIAMWGGDPYDEALVIDRLQRLAPIPLLVGTDNEWGLAMRVGGSSSFPKAMALGATRDTALARESGFVTGRETRAIGIHMGYGPVADVNNNPDNPIISIRSFGEDPMQVARMARAWARGARAAGMLVTPKHFPGHGDVSVDSHIDLPVVPVDMERLNQVELVPFRQLVEQGVDAIMVAHLWLPAFNPDETVPASLSGQVIEGLLRGELGFEGLVVTDALRMGALVQHYGPEEVAVRAVEAGVDMLLLPVDAARTVDAIVSAVESGRISADRVRRAASRALTAKARVGLHVRRTVPLEQVDRVVGDPGIADLAEAIARRSITVVKNEGDMLPLGAGGVPAPPDTTRYGRFMPPMALGPFQSRLDRELQPEPVGQDTSRGARVLFLGLSSDPGSGPLGSAFFRELRQIFPRARHRSLYPDYDREEAAAVMAAVDSSDLVVAAVFSRVRDQKGHAAVLESHAALLRYISARGTPTAVAAFGPPYFLRQFPAVTAYVTAYDYTDRAQRAAGGVFLGAIAARGRLPVSLPGLYPVGWGIRVGPAVGR
jgi:beta-glucosidase-like glycosyl hydrolase